LLIRIVDELHYKRLLGVEERPCIVLTDKLLGKDSLLRTLPHQHLPSPPPEGEEERPFDPDGEAFKRQKFREEVLLRFSTLESSLLRIQLIQTSNQRERERYAAEKAKILETAQAVRENTKELRTRLEEAQQIMELRKGYDELAGKILDDKKLKSREDCQDEIANLEKEIEDLQQESAEYEGTWLARREQFDRVVAEGDAMVRLIKGIKDEPETEHEQDEDMDGSEDGGKGESSMVGTPAAGGRTPMPEGGRTPMLEGSDATPLPTNRFLDVEDATRTNSRAVSPLRQEETQGEDVDMSGIGEGEDESAMAEAAGQPIEQVEAVAEQMDES
jgi:hypothetical protein